MSDFVFLHVSFAEPPQYDAKTFEAVLNVVVSDWLRYCTNCYIVWTDKSTEELLETNLGIPGMEDTYIVVCEFAEPFGVLPSWCWEWYVQDRGAGAIKLKHSIAKLESEKRPASLE